MPFIASRRVHLLWIGDKLTTRVNGGAETGGLGSRGMIGESGREDLNLRPHGPEPCALADLRYAPAWAVTLHRSWSQTLAIYIIVYFRYICKLKGYRDFEAIGG